MFNRTSKIGEVCRLDEKTDVIKLPKGVLIRTCAAKRTVDSGISIHTVYLSDNEYFGEETH